MNLKTYVELSERTLIDKGQTMNLLHAQMGIMTECGELADQIKRHLFYGTELDIVNIKEEIGDIMWYIAILFRRDKINTLRLRQNFDTDIKDLPEVFEALTSIIALSQDLHEYEVSENIFYELLCITKYFKLDMEDILEISINKLLARFPDKFSEHHAVNRDLNKERQVLEGIVNE